MSARAHLAQGEHPLLHTNGAALQHQEVVGHLSVVHKATLLDERSQYSEAKVTWSMRLHPSKDIITSKLVFDLVPLTSSQEPF